MTSDFDFLSFTDEYSRVATKVYSIAREMEKFQVDAIPELEMNSNEKFQRAMEVLVKVGANYVLVICRPENLATILDRVGRSYPEFLKN